MQSGIISQKNYRYSELINQFPVELSRAGNPALVLFYITAFNQASAINEAPAIDG